MEADYVIVGAGAAGCVLAARLSEDPTISVLLLESGGRGRHLLLRIPKAFYLTMQHPEYAYFYPTGSVSPGGPDEVWLRGKGLGGSTAVNGMMYIRGWAADYDRLAAAGDPGWGWAGMLPVFRAMEDHELGASLLRGVGGPLHVSVTAVADPVVAAMLRSATAAGLADVDDFNASDAERIGRTPVTIHRGVRISAATAFLRPARRRRNLTVLDRTHVGHVTLEGGRAVGVVARRGGERLAVRARREVILAAGSIESPQLLERSGIGDPVVLTRAGVEPRVESPHVGERLLEHRGMTVQARLRPGLGLNRRLNTLPRQLCAGAGYVLTRRGPVATGPYDLVGQLRSAPGEPRPDVQILLTPMSLDLGTDPATARQARRDDDPGVPAPADDAERRPHPLGRSRGPAGHRGPLPRDRARPNGHRANPGSAAGDDGRGTARGSGDRRGGPGPRRRHPGAGRRVCPRDRDRHLPRRGVLRDGPQR